MSSIRQIVLTKQSRDWNDRYYPEITAWVLYSDVIFDGDQMQVINDCLCAEYEHEISNYFREGLVHKELKSGDEVSFVGCFTNCYGKYCIVSKDGIKYHVKPSNLKIVHPYTQEELTKKVESLRLELSYVLSPYPF